MASGFLDRLKDALEVTEMQLAGVVGIARQTLVRRWRYGVLRRDEGDRAATVAKVYNMALSYFDGNREHSLDRLEHPNPALAGEVPLKCAATAPGTASTVRGVCGTQRIWHEDMPRPIDESVFHPV